MAKVFVNTVCPKGNQGAEDSAVAQHARIMDLAANCDEHCVVRDPDDADIILLYPSFTLFFAHLDRARITVRRHALRRQYMNKTFVYEIDDNPFPFLPGVYASVSRHQYDAQRQRPGPYIHYLGNALWEARRPIADSAYLFSFVGDPTTHAVRPQLLGLKHPRARLVQTPRRWPQSGKARAEFKRRYADSMHSSKFVLCPRGRGTGSTRVFEVMQAGRVPVIIADDWLPPAGPDWNSFSLRVPEDSVTSIPALLEKREPVAPRMADSARAAWEAWFSERSVFKRLVDSCLDLQRQRRSSERWQRFRVLPQLCRPKSLRRVVLAPVFESIHLRSFVQTVQHLSRPTPKGTQR